MKTQHMKSVAARAAIALSAVSLLALPALAVPTAPKAPQEQPTTSSQQHQAPRGPLSVSYYAGNPAQGGKLLTTTTLPPAGGATKGPQGNTPDKRDGRHEHRGHHGGFGPLKDQAPTGATFAVIKEASGQSRTIDLTRTPLRAPQGGQRGPAAPK